MGAWFCVIENCKGGLWLTTMGRVVLDNHSCETFAEPFDRKLMSAEELTKGIRFEEFLKRMVEKRE